MTERTFKRGDRVLVWGTLNSPTNERTPSGLWWVNVDGHAGCVAVQECDMTNITGRALPQLTGDDAPCAHLCFCERGSNRAEIALLRVALKIAQEFMPIVRREMPHQESLERAHDMVAAALEQREP